MAGNKGTLYPQVGAVHDGSRTNRGVFNVQFPDGARPQVSPQNPDAYAQAVGNLARQGGMHPMELGSDGGREFTEDERATNTRAMHAATLASGLQKPTEVHETIASFVQSAFTAAASYRRQMGVDQEMIDGMYAFAGKYSPDALAKLEKMKEPPVYAPLTMTKCRAYSAWVRDIIEQTGQDLFRVESTPVPDLPDDVMKDVMDATMASLQRTGNASTAGQVHETLRSLALESAQATAEAAARRMEQVMSDQLRESRFREFWLRAQVDISHLPYMVIRGPFFQKSNRLRWDPSSRAGIGVDDKPVQKSTYVLDWERIPPWMFYLSPGANNVADADYVIDRRAYTASKLSKMSGLAGVNESALARLLAVSPRDVQASRRGGAPSGSNMSREDLGNVVAKSEDIYYASTSYEREMSIPVGTVGEMVQSDLSNVTLGGTKTPAHSRMYASHYGSGAGAGEAETATSGETYMITVFVGQVSNRLLDEYGITLSGRMVPHDHTECEIWVCGNEVIRMMVQPYAENRRPYHMSVFADSSGHGYGRSLPSMNEAAQAKANTAMRAIALNAPRAARPTIMADMGRILNVGIADEDIAAPGSLIEYQESEPGAPGGVPVRYLMHPSIVREMESSLRDSQALADVLTGIPAYAGGSPVSSGAGRTSSGLTMLLNAAARGVKDNVFRQDIYVLEPALQMLYLYNMMYSRDKAIKADARITVRGSRGVLEREMKAAASLEAMTLTIPLVGPGIVKPDEARDLWFAAMRALGVDIKTDPRKQQDLLMSPGIGAGTPDQQAQQLPQPGGLPALGPTPGAPPGPPGIPEGAEETLAAPRTIGGEAGADGGAGGGGSLDAFALLSSLNNGA